MPKVTFRLEVTRFRVFRAGVPVGLITAEPDGFWVTRRLDGVELYAHEDLRAAKEQARVTDWRRHAGAAEGVIL
jgi:hypothetical protein